MLTETDLSLGSTKSHLFYNFLPFFSPRSLYLPYQKEGRPKASIWSLGDSAGKARRLYSYLQAVYYAKPYNQLPHTAEHRSRVSAGVCRLSVFFSSRFSLSSYQSLYFFNLFSRKCKMSRFLVICTDSRSLTMWERTKKPILNCGFLWTCLPLVGGRRTKTPPSPSRGRSRPSLSGIQRRALNLQLHTVGVCMTYFCKWRG